MKNRTKTGSNPVPDTFEELVAELCPRAIHDRIDYDNAIEMIRRLAVIPRHTPGQLHYFETLGILVEAYERKHFAIRRAKVSPLELLQSIMEDLEMKGTDLAKLLGVSQPLVSRILKGERRLTADHARKLGERFKMRADAFLG